MDLLAIRRLDPSSAMASYIRDGPTSSASLIQLVAVYLASDLLPVHRAFNGAISVVSLAGHESSHSRPTVPFIFHEDLLVSSSCFSTVLTR